MEAMRHVNTTQSRLGANQLTGQSMNDELTPMERRGRAPMHFWMTGRNAYFAAYALWTASQTDQSILADEIGYSDDPTSALRESFLREACICLELTVKAVIAQHLEMGIADEHVTRIRAIHRIPELWKDAQLPALADEDALTLVIAKWVLAWNGRCPTPNKAEHYAEEERDEASLRKYTAAWKGKRLYTTRSINWEQFDQVYGIAASSFVELHRRADITGIYQDE
jgi:hypothetical protein